MMTAPHSTHLPSAPALRQPSPQRGLLAMIVGGGASAAAAYGIVGTVTRDSIACAASTCTSAGLLTALAAGGLIVAIVAMLFSGWSIVTSPVIAMAAAAVAVQRQGYDVFGDHFGKSIFFAGCVLLGPGVVAIMALGGRARANAAADLMANGERGIAHVLGARQTGIYINERPQVAIDFTIQPLDGSPVFAYHQKRVLDITAVVPRPGLAWPCWYRPIDQSKVAIASPSGGPIDSSTQQLFAEFGLSLTQAYGYDPVGVV